MDFYTKLFGFVEDSQTGILVACCRVRCLIIFYNKNFEKIRRAEIIKVWTISEDGSATLSWQAFLREEHDTMLAKIQRAFREKKSN